MFLACLQLHSTDGGVFYVQPKKNPRITNFTSAYLGCQCGTRRSRHALVRGHLTTVTWFSEFLPPPALLKTANRMLLFDKTHLSFLTQTLEEGKVSDM
jgi:hypothetical protein